MELYSLDHIKSVVINMHVWMFKFWFKLKKKKGYTEPNNPNIKESNRERESKICLEMNSDTLQTSKRKRKTKMILICQTYRRKKSIFFLLSHEKII